jgi:hypothetical protein
VTETTKKTATRRSPEELKAHYLSKLRELETRDARRDKKKLQRIHEELKEIAGRRANDKNVQVATQHVLSAIGQIPEVQ